MSYAEVPKAGTRCAQCGASLDSKFAICPGCGSNLDAAPVRPLPLKYEWGPVPSCSIRLGIFISYEVVVLAACFGFGLYDEMSLLELSVHGLLVSAFAGFSLGTFDQLDLRRTYEGRVSLTKTRWLAFIPWRKGAKISPRGYEGLATTENFESTAVDWLLVMWLFSLCGIPGIIWLIIMFNRPTYQVALTREHGLPALIVWRGRDKQRMHDVAKAVAEVFRFRVRTG